jgi:WD40 repeat protein
MYDVRCSKLLVPIRGRGGFIALGEMACVVILLAGLFWLLCGFMAAITNNPTSSSSQTSGCTDRCVYRMTLDREGRRLWVNRPREGIMQLNLATSGVEQSLPLMGMELAAVAHSRDGSTTLLSGIDGTVIRYRHGEIAGVAQVLLVDDVIADATVSHDGEMAACVTTKGRVFGWSRSGADTPDIDYSLSPGARIVRIGFNGNSHRMYVARTDGTVSFHRPATGAPDGTDLLHQHDVGSKTDCVAFAWSENGRLLAVACSDGHIETRDVATGRIIFEDTLRIGDVPTRPMSLAISPDGQWIAAAANHSPIIRIWNLQTGKPSGGLKGHVGMVRVLQFSPVGNHLYSGSYDGTIREWSLATNSELRIVD